MENLLEWVLNAKKTILNGIKILLIICFCLGKYSFRLDIFWAHLS